MGIPIIGQDIPLLGEDDKKRVENCLKKVQEVLDRYECVIIPVITIAGTKIIAQMDIVAKRKGPAAPPGQTPN